jgi:hypothetical protein
MSLHDAVKLHLMRSEGYAHIEAEAQKEVALAMQKPLKDQYGTDQYHYPRLLLKEFQAECDRFEKAGIKVLPADLVDILFGCRLLRATKNEQEYRQRGGGSSPFGTRPNLPNWTDRTTPLDSLVEQYVNALEADIRERTLITHISSFNSGPQEAITQQSFFEDLFTALGVPLVAFLDSDHLIEKHQLLEPGLRTYDAATAKEFFSASSFGYTVRGTKSYCFWHGTAWLRTFLTVLRIAGFIHPGQREFTLGPQMEPPTFPVFLGMHSHGSYQWDEDKKESWEKLPDGCLFRSFGFRGLSNMWLDLRNFPGIKKFMLNHKSIFDTLKNPWSLSNTNDVAPTLDILSSATQIPDLGAKILLIYCCLEHLFVPEEAGAENSKYIIGGLNALKPQLVSWFHRLYGQRCEYAHKGFVLRNDESFALISDSMKNVMSILVAKLSVL